MRVICPYEPTIDPHTWSSLDRFAPQAEFVELGPRPDAYWNLLSSLWAATEPFIIVEQDVEIHERAIRSLTHCARPWCVFPYSGPRSSDGDALFYQALGCTRFRSSLMVQGPSVFASFSSHDWRGLDSRLAGALRALGHKPHVHWPEVLHHHAYPNGCACGSDHKEEFER